MKEKMINGLLGMLEKAVEVSYESASMYGMHQAEEPESINEFLKDSKED